MGYDPLPSLFNLMLKLSQIWQVGAVSESFYKKPILLNYKFYILKYTHIAVTSMSLLSVSLDLPFLEFHRHWIIYEIDI